VVETDCRDEDCLDPSFTWTSSTDGASGVAGYGLYFGSDPRGTSDAFTTDLYYDPPQAEDVWWIFRMRTLDIAGNWSSWQTLYHSSAFIDSYVPLITH
jgi:hypothetical protein